MFPKPKRYVSLDYLNFIRQLPCCVCGKEGEPHHLKSRGSGGSDLESIPLCRKEHSEYHNWGPEKFSYLNQIDIYKEHNNILKSYIVELERRLNEDIGS